MPERLDDATPEGVIPDAAATRLPLFEEAARVETRDAPGERVRLHTLVREHDQRVEAALRDEDVTVERLVVDRAVAEAPPVREEGDTLIVPVLEERLVIEKRLILKEEIRIRRRARTRTEQHTVRLRAEDVRVERLPPDGPEEDGSHTHEKES
jgi:uncharacterized protein (TIGR02271 family)